MTVIKSAAKTEVDACKVLTFVNKCIYLSCYLCHEKCVSPKRTYGYILIKFIPFDMYDDVSVVT